MYVSNPFRRNNIILLMLVASFFSAFAHASGVMLGSTRIIFPLDEKQTSIAIKNTSTDDRYLVQSSVGDENGKKSNDFFLTPPLFVSNPGQENSLRLMLTNHNLPKDKESVYYLTAKAIPSIDKDKVKGKNTLMIAVATRIKVFVRPEGLQPEVEKAPELIQVSRNGNSLTIKNPTPYYITLVKIKANNKELNTRSVMISPKGSTSLHVDNNAKDFSFSVVNDFGGISEQINKKI